ncbi:Enoyl-[acyl-carrier-protein] reductase 2 [Fusarium oxysporum f. sp. albedinis]|nr:Enoyl-[acyl-carrier-protein] reductase 2 [Fusarium oxysporum f. sp. albedinis]
MKTFNEPGKSLSTQLSGHGLTLIPRANSPEEEKKLFKLEPGTTAVARFLGTDVPNLILTKTDCRTGCPVLDCAFEARLFGGMYDASIIL